MFAIYKGVDYHKVIDEHDNIYYNNEIYDLFERLRPCFVHEENCLFLNEICHGSENKHPDPILYLTYDESLSVIHKHHISKLHLYTKTIIM